MKNEISNENGVLTIPRANKKPLTWDASTHLHIQQNRKYLVDTKEREFFVVANFFLL